MFYTTDYNAVVTIPQAVIIFAGAGLETHTLNGSKRHLQQSLLYILIIYPQFLPVNKKQPPSFFDSSCYLFVDLSNFLANIYLPLFQFNYHNTMMMGGKPIIGITFISFTSFPYKFNSLVIVVLIILSPFLYYTFHLFINYLMMILITDCTS